MTIPKQMLKEWCETYEEAIETLDYLANRSLGTAKEEIKGYTDVDAAKDYLFDKGLKPYNQPVRRSDKKK